MSLVESLGVLKMVDVRLEKVDVLIFDLDVSILQLFLIRRNVVHRVVLDVPKLRLIPTFVQAEGTYVIRGIAAIFRKHCRADAHVASVATRFPSVLASFY